MLKVELSKNKRPAEGQAEAADEQKEEGVEGVLANMDPATAEQLLVNGATFILLDLPERSQFGINKHSWATGPKFKGVKMIPPGFHFLFHSATSADGRVAPRIGSFYYFHRGEFVVRKYDRDTEDLKPEAASEAELEAFRTNLKDLDKSLAPYPYDDHKQWFSLTNHISERLMKRLEPRNKLITMQADLITREADATGGGPSVVDREHPVRVRFCDLEGLPIMRLREGTEIRFTPLPGARLALNSLGRSAASPAEITAQSMDRSGALETLLASYREEQTDDGGYHDERDAAADSFALLGELQFAFLCFLVGHVYAAFEHWRDMLGLLCSCDRALATHGELYLALITTLHFQLKETPRDFFVDVVERNNFLVASLSSLFARIETTDGVSTELRAKAKKFKDFLTKKYQWDFVEDTDEYLPVLVPE